MDRSCDNRPTVGFISLRLSQHQIGKFSMTARSGADSKCFSEDDGGVWGCSHQRGLWAELLLGGLGVKPPSINTCKSILPAFLHINARYMRRSQSACYTYRRRWGCIILILSPVSAPEWDLIAYWQSLSCVLLLLQHLLYVGSYRETTVSNFCQARYRLLH